MIRRFLVFSALFAAISCPLSLSAQERKLEKFRTGGGSASAAQMSIWFAKEGNYYDKKGLNVEVISIPGSSLAIQAMLSGELPVIQAGGAGPIQAALSGTDTVIIATIAKKFNWWIFSQPNINRIEDLRGKIFGTTRFGTQSDLASRIALRRAASIPNTISPWSRPAGRRKPSAPWSPAKFKLRRSRRRRRCRRAKPS